MGRHDDDDDYEDDEEEIEQILFQGAVNGQDANLKKNARLARAGLVPAKEIISDAVDRRAHDLYIEPKGGRAAMRIMVDGIGYPAGAMPGKRAMAVIQMVKLLAGLDIEERSKPQTGGIKAEFHEVPYELQVHATPIKPGIERLRVHIENLKTRLMKPADVGFTEDFKSKIREITSQQAGLLLICGPSGSGATTTSYCVLNTVDAFLYSVFSLADVGTREMYNVTNFEIEEGHDLEMALESILRKEANVVFMDKLGDGDEEIAKTICQFGEKISTICEIDAPDPTSAIQKFSELCGSAETAADVIKGVITQKLLRQLCDDCKQAFRPNPKMLQKLGLPRTTKVLYREPVVDEEDPEAPTVEELCEECDGMPYHGRAGMYELIEVTEGMKEVIRNGASAEAIARQADEDEMQTLQKDGLRLVGDGVTSLEELKRAFAGPRKKKRPMRRRRPG